MTANCFLHEEKSLRACDGEASLKKRERERKDCHLSLFIFSGPPALTNKPQKVDQSWAHSLSLPACAYNAPTSTSSAERGGRRASSTQQPPVSSPAFCPGGVLEKEKRVGLKVTSGKRGDRASTGKMNLEEERSIWIIEVGSGRV